MTWKLQPSWSLPPAEAKALRWTNAVAFSPGGSLVASGHDNGLCIWNVVREGTRARLDPARSVQSGTVDGVAFTDNGHFVLTAGPSGFAMWSSTSGERMRSWSIKRPYVPSPFGDEGYNPPDFSKNHIAPLPDGDTALAWQDLGEMAVYNFKYGMEVRKYSIGDTERVGCAVVSPDGEHFLTSHAQRVNVWSLSRGQVVGGMGTASEALGVSEDGRYALAAVYGGNLELLDIHERRVVRKMAGHEGHIRGVAFLPGGHFALSAGGPGSGSPDDNTIRLWHVDSGRQEHCFLQQNAFGFTGIAVSPDGSLVVAGSVDGATILLFTLPEPYAARPGQPIVPAPADAIRWNCSGCGRRLRAAVHATGKKAKCPSCHRSVIVPSR